MLTIKRPALKCDHFMLSCSEPIPWARPTLSHFSVYLESWSHTHTRTHACTRAHTHGIGFYTLYTDWDRVPYFGILTIMYWVPWEDHWLVIITCYWECEFVNCSWNDNCVYILCMSCLPCCDYLYMLWLLDSPVILQVHCDCVLIPQFLFLCWV